MKKLFLFVATALLSVTTFAGNISCAEAKAKIDASDKSEYTVEGFVTAIESAPDAFYKNLSLWLADEANGGKVFEVYRLSFKGVEAADVPVVGDKIAVTATLKKYSPKSGDPIYETDKISGFEILVKGSGERWTNEDVAIVEINVAKAVEIGNALADNETTKQMYGVSGYAVTAYDPIDEKGTQTFFMADEKGAFGELQAFKCTPLSGEAAVAENDYVIVFGQIQKYVKDDKTQIEISFRPFKHIEETAIENTAVSVKAMKVMENGQLYIIRNGVKYNAAGAVVE